MKVLILGRGVIGSQYGWALEQAGHQVDFLVREKAGSTYADTLELHTYDGRKKTKVAETWLIHLLYEIPANVEYDVILISVNPEQVASAVERVAAFAKDSTILLMGNFGGNPVDSLTLLPRDQFVVGFPSAGGGITGNVLHGILYGSLQIGIAGEQSSQREETVRKLFASAGFKVSAHKDIESWLWNHYVLNAAMETEVLRRGSFEAVVSSRDGLSDMLRNAKEMTGFLKAKGIQPDMALKAMGLLPPTLMAALMKRTMYKEGTPAYEAVAYNRYAVGHSVREIYNEARALGVSLPRVEAVL